MDNEMIEEIETEEQPLEDKDEKLITVNGDKDAAESGKVDEALVKEACQEINRIFSQHTEKAIKETGEYLILDYQVFEAIL